MPGDVKERYAKVTDAMRQCDPADVERQRRNSIAANNVRRRGKTDEAEPDMSLVFYWTPLSIHFPARESTITYRAVFTITVIMGCEHVRRSTIKLYNSFLAQVLSFQSRRRMNNIAFATTLTPIFRHNRSSIYQSLNVSLKDCTSLSLITSPK